MSLLQTALNTDKGINITNMSLMVISAALSFLFPFELFLFVYAILGPLHYITEMSWLERRNFFIEKKGDVWLYLLMAILLTIPAFNAKASVARFGVSFLLMSVCFTFIIFFVKQPILKYIITFAVFLFIAAGLKPENYHFAFIWIGVMLPTIIHVFIFTGLFILYGALKNKSATGIASLFVFIACAASFFLFIPGSPAEAAHPYLQKTLSNFNIINKILLLQFGLDSNVHSLPEALDMEESLLFVAPGAIAVARFIAFAYTYHYLNWFSKTTVIKWHEVSKLRMVIILLLWIGSIIAYVANYNIGFKLLFLFSMMHVLLEFPLNFVTVRGIGKETIALFRKKA